MNGLPVSISDNVVLTDSPSLTIVQGTRSDPFRIFSFKDIELMLPHAAPGKNRIEPRDFLRNKSIKKAIKYFIVFAAEIVFFVMALG